MKIVREKKCPDKKQSFEPYDECTVQKNTKESGMDDANEWHDLKSLFEHFVRISRAKFITDEFIQPAEYRDIILSINMSMHACECICACFWLNNKDCENEA